jgi:hypothetical protein
MGKRLSLGVETRKRRQERRVNIEDRVRESVQQRGTDEPHVTGETDQANVSRS